LVGFSQKSESLAKKAAEKNGSLLQKSKIVAKNWVIERFFSAKIIDRLQNLLNNKKDSFFNHLSKNHQFKSVDKITPPGI
jgi:energy-converting hydrogenase A subunit M